ncbi:sporulation protein [Paraconexibacter sp. AEG42_29]|uniref:Sporulation protein n=1 Tax=Paraconexibacter sp. AEG42_29 TaxID=2997339 RepID=A0AAU7B3G8_9ACTN
MNPRHFAALAVALVTLAAPAAGSAQSPSGCANAATPIAELDAVQARTALKCALGKLRSDAGLSAYRESPKLTSAAQDHANDMIARDYFDHVSPGGSDPGTRAKKAGYPNAYVGEIIAGGSTADENIALWLDSPPHKTAMLSTRYAEAGFGNAASADSSVAVVVVGSPGGPSKPKPAAPASTPCTVDPRNGPVAFCPRYVKNSGNQGVYRIRGHVVGESYSALTMTISRGPLTKTFTIKVSANGRFDKVVRGPKLPKNGGVLRYKASIVVDGRTIRYGGDL